MAAADGDNGDDGDVDSKDDDDSNDGSQLLPLKLTEPLAWGAYDCVCISVPGSSQ